MTIDNKGLPFGSVFVSLWKDAGVIRCLEGQCKAYRAVPKAHQYVTTLEKKHFKKKKIDDFHC